MTGRRRASPEFLGRQAGLLKHRRFVKRGPADLNSGRYAHIQSDLRYGYNDERDGTLTLNVAHEFQGWAG